ncbi:MAG: helix-turn-helix domain-containing protein [Acidimicrobiia bacterium]
MSDSPEVPSLTMTVGEAARFLGIGRNSAYEAVRRNEIPSIRIGRRIVIPRHRFLEWLGASDTDSGGAQQ